MAGLHPARAVPIDPNGRAASAHARHRPMRLVYSTRTPDTVLYGDELRRVAECEPQLDVELVYTRRAPEGWKGPVGRLDAARLATLAWPPAAAPACFVCGPTGFVDAVANLLIIDQGYAPERIKTERFGPSGS